MPEIVPKREYVSIYFKNYTKCKLNLSWQRADHRLPAEGGVIKGWRKPEEAMIMFTILCFIGGVRKSKLIQLYTLKSVGSNSKIKKSSKVILLKKKKKDFKKLSKTKTSSLGVDQFHRWELPFLFLSLPSSQDRQTPFREPWKVYKTLD